MGYIINDKNFINDNIFKFEKRLESQYTIFLEKNPTFVTYYHINNINSITDSGLLNVDQILGPNSPLRYQLINDLPIYGLDQIKLDLNDDDEGLNSSYEGEGIILPNTIKPLPNDFFTISYLDKNYLFMVTQIDYDTIKSNNFYKINFILKTMDDESATELSNQVLEKYNCIFKNIGTDDKCLLEEEGYVRLLKLNDLYKKLVERYVTIFYSKRFNSFVFNNLNHLVYDKYLTHFINRHGLLNEKEKYETFLLSNEDDGDYFIIEYDSSIFDKIEERNIESLDQIHYIEKGITNSQSIFKYYNLDDVKSIYFLDTGNTSYIKDSIIEGIITNHIPDDANILDSILIQYFNNTIESIYQIDLENLNRYRINYNWNDFIMVPILLYILRFYTDKFMQV